MYSTLLSAAHRDVVSVSTSRSRDVVSKRLGLVSVSYHRVSFTSQYAQLFASLQNCTFIVLNAGRIIMVAQTIIFSSCSLFLLLSFLFSSPNLIRRRVDVYHTSTHGVALVRIQNAGLKRAARGSL